MARVVSIGAQNFEKLIVNDYFYIDKTQFIREWWESGDEVTLITRPRRFGKTLNMNMLERFWSVEYREQGEVFQNLAIWEDEKYRKLQGTYPVIFLSFAIVKARDYQSARATINELLVKLYERNSFIKRSGLLGEKEIEYYDRVSSEMSEGDAALALHQMSDFLCRYYGKKVIILLDEYDTPMQEAYLSGYWEEMSSFIRRLFNATFKTNPYLEKALMTGITRIGKESLFSDLNNLKVVTMVSDKYASCFGFTEEEVFTAMDEFGMTNKGEVKRWYDVMLKPLNQDDDGIILEFKVFNPQKEATLRETVQMALRQIEEKQYEQMLQSQGIGQERIRKYGFAFEGKKVLIG